MWRSKRGAASRCRAARRAPVIAALESAIRRTADSPDFTSGGESFGVRPAFLPAAEFSELIAREDADLARLMQLISLKK